MGEINTEPKQFYLWLKESSDFLDEVNKEKIRLNASPYAVFSAD